MNPLEPYMIWIKLAGAALAAAMIAGASWWVTATYYQLQISDNARLQQTQVIIAQDQAAHTQAAADKITADDNAAASERRQQQLQQVIANLRKVSQYVSPETDKHFPLPCGFVRLHDAGANGIEPAAVPLPAGKTDGDECPVTPSAAASIIQSNYGLALGWKAEVDGWWDWYAKQAANWNKPPETKGSGHASN